jgi:lipoate-protein ligase A
LRSTDGSPAGVDCSGTRPSWGGKFSLPGTTPRFLRPAESLYELLCQGAIRGLEKLGVRAAFRPKNDIEVNGRKISGTGGTSMDGAFLFQGTLLVDFDVDTMLRALRIPTEKLKDKEIASVRERVTCLAWELGAPPPLPQIKAALVAASRKHWVSSSHREP